MICKGIICGAFSEKLGVAGLSTVNQIRPETLESIGWRDLMYLKRLGWGGKMGSPMQRPVQAVVANLALDGIRHWDAYFGVGVDVNHLSWGQAARKLMEVPGGGAPIDMTLKSLRPAGMTLKAGRFHIMIIGCVVYIPHVFWGDVFCWFFCDLASPQEIYTWPGWLNEVELIISTIVLGRPKPQENDEAWVITVVVVVVVVVVPRQCWMACTFYLGSKSTTTQIYQDNLQNHWQPRIRSNELVQFFYQVDVIMEHPSSPKTHVIVLYGYLIMYSQEVIAPNWLAGCSRHVKTVYESPPQQKRRNTIPVLFCLRKNNPDRKWVFPKIGVPQNGWFIIYNGKPF